MLLSAFEWDIYAVVVESSPLILHEVKQRVQGHWPEVPTKRKFS
jgi:hypothetical protein